MLFRHLFAQKKPCAKPACAMSQRSDGHVRGDRRECSSQEAGRRKAETLNQKAASEYLLAIQQLQVSAAALTHSPTHGPTHAANSNAKKGCRLPLQPNHRLSAVVCCSAATGVS